MSDGNTINTSADLGVQEFYLDAVTTGNTSQTFLALEVNGREYVTIRLNNTGAAVATVRLVGFFTDSFGLTDYLAAVDVAGGAQVEFSGITKHPRIVFTGLSKVADTPTTITAAIWVR